jgi:hypothetical protein
VIVAGTEKREMGFFLYELCVVWTNLNKIDDDDVVVNKDF